jgi:hypothetical protein
MNFPPLRPGYAVQAEKGFYVHYKHDPSGEAYNYMYEVVGVGRHSEDKTYTVLYRPLYTSEWLKPADYAARPLDMFMEDVEVDGKIIKRFTHITDPVLISELEKKRDEMYG